MLTSLRRAASLVLALGAASLLAGPAANAAHGSGLLHKARFDDGEACLDVRDRGMDQADSVWEKYNEAEDADRKAYWLGKRCGYLKYVKAELLESNCNGEELDDVNRDYERALAALDRANREASKNYECSLTP